MPAGACTLRWVGKRRVSWSIKFLDASGRQVRELLGHEPEWNEKKAKAALRRRLVDVERDGFRKPESVAFESFARKWLDTYPESRDHRLTTRADYKRLVENHFIPAFRRRRVGDITTADIDAYLAVKRKAGLAPRTLCIHLTRLGSIFDTARRQGLIQANPVKDAERPRVPRSRWTILSPAEIASVTRALDALIAEDATEDGRAWRQTAKAMTVTMLYAWLRRGELLGLRWRDLELGHPDGPRLHVRETWVRGYRSAPKTDESMRTIALEDDGPAAEELWQHRRRSNFDGDDELVFCHPLKGTPIPSGYFSAIMKTALAVAGVNRPMREFHDWRHTGITNAAAAGMQPLAIMRMAGHSNFKTTQRYIDLAGVVFGDEVRRLSDWYGAGTKKRYEIARDASSHRIGSEIAAASD
jgi:integrase